MDAEALDSKSLDTQSMLYDTIPNFVRLVIFCMYSSTGYLLKELEITIIFGFTRAYQLK
jgi:hypothetical protein